MRSIVKSIICLLVLAGPVHADDMTVLRMNDSQRSQLFNYLETNTCDCGCGFTIGQCLRDDPTCPISPKLARSAIQNILGGSAGSTSNPTVTSPTKQSYRPAGKLDNSLLGAWVRRTSGGSGVYYENTLKMIFSPDGRIAYGSGTIVSGGTASASIRGGGDNPVDHGSWSVNGSAIHINWDDGTKGDYDYEVFEYDGRPALMMVFNGSKRYFKSVN